MAILAISGVVYATVVVAYGTSPYTTNVGYSPRQPVPFSHKIHVGNLKMDCRYCHSTVDKAAHAAVPATQTCVNCHSAANPDGSVANSAIHTNSEKLLARPREPGNRQAGRVAKSSRPARLRLFRPQRACEPRRGLCLVPRPRGQDGRGLSGRATLNGMVPRLPSQP